MRQALGLAMLTALAVPALADDKGTDDEKLVGTWEMVQVDEPLKKQTFERGDLTMCFSKGGKLTTKRKGAPEEDSTFKVSSGKSPKELDWEIPGGTTTKVLYRIDGDTLVMAVPRDGPRGDRPTGFTLDKAILVTYKRQKP